MKPAIIVLLCKFAYHRFLFTACTLPRVNIRDAHQACCPQPTLNMYTSNILCKIEIHTTYQTKIYICLVVIYVI